MHLLKSGARYANQVAWLKEETKTIISIDTNIIITNYRIFLIPDEEEKRWALHIKDVQESDRVSRYKPISNVRRLHTDSKVGKPIELTIKMSTFYVGQSNPRVFISAK